MAILAVDVLVLCPDRARWDGASLALLSPRPAASCHEPSHQLAGRHGLHGVHSGNQVSFLHVLADLLSQLVSGDHAGDGAVDLE